MLLLTYDRLDLDDLRGTSQADYLVVADATLQIIDRDGVIYEEPSFPVVELARGLLRWMDDSTRGDFDLESMSFEETGTVSIVHTSTGWVLGSIYAERSSEAVEWDEVERCVAAFIARVERDLRSADVDAALVLAR